MSTNIKRLGNNKVYKYSQDGTSSCGIWFPVNGPAGIGELDPDGGKRVGLSSYTPDPAPKIWMIDCATFDPPAPGGTLGLTMPEHTSTESAWYLIHLFNKLSPNLDVFELVSQSGGGTVSLNINSTPNLFQILVIWDGQEWNALMDKSV